MTMSRHAKVRKSTAHTRNEIRPPSDIAVNTRSSLASTAKPSLSNSSGVAKDRKKRAQPIAPQRQNNNDDDELPILEPIPTQSHFQKSPEMPMLDSRAPILSTATIKPRPAKSRKSLQRASDNARVYPAPAHHRPSPYTPTLQNGGAFPKERGNGPAGVSDAVWAKAFNAANTHIHNLMAASTRIVVARQAREVGLTRDLAVEGLIGKGV